MAAVPAIIDRGQMAKQEFGGSQTLKSAETSIAAAAAREEAIIKAEYVMAERHPRNWMDVRAAMLDHCKRPRFAEISRYAKPIGRKKVNGEWIEDYARGFTARFAETLAQEMGNVKPFSSVTYEDDLIRVVRIGVTDLERNLVRSREVTFTKAVERRGKQDKKTGEWTAPDGREVISQRINSYGDPVYLVKATEDEMRNKVNSEESKTQRDFLSRLCPRDILEECEERVIETLAAEDKRDPLAALKKTLDRFREFGIMASDLEQYLGKSSKQFTATDIAQLRELGAAIRDGQLTFDEALKAKYTAPSEDGGEQAGSAKEAEAVAEKKIAELSGKPAVQQQPTVTTTEAPAQPAADLPPALLEDLPEWPADPKDEWYKISGKIYRLDRESGNWREWQPAPKQTRSYGRRS